jgi:hypothetical protein
MGMGIILSALSAAGNSGAQSIDQQQRVADEQRLMQQRADLEEQKAKSIEQFRYDLANAPQARAGDILRDATSQQVPDQATPVATLDKAGAQAAGLDVGLQGNIADLRAQQNAILTNPSASDDQKQTAKEILAQIETQVTAQQKLAQDAVAGKTHTPTSAEALQVAMQKALANGDTQAYAALKALAGEKYMTVPEGGGVLNTVTGQLTTTGAGKEERQRQHDERMAQKTLEAKWLEIDPYGTNPNNPFRAKGQGDGVGQNGENGLTGEQLLASLPRQTADQVKALAEGRMQFPAGFSAKSPYWQNMISLVSQYDPSFDAVNFNARASTRKAFTSGKEAASVNALNTVLGHLDSLGQAADDLNNSSVPLWNSVTNYLASSTGDPRVKKFEATKKAVVDELTRAWRGSGGSEGDIKSWSSTLDAAASPEQLHGVIGQLGELLESKISALNDQYGKGMGTTSGGLNLLSPHSAEVLKRIKKRAGIETGDSDTAGATGQAPSSQPSATGGIKFLGFE